MFWGLSLSGWDTLVPLLFAISVIFAILGGGATYVSFKLHKQEAVNAKDDLKRYKLTVEEKVNAAEEKRLAAVQAAKDALLVAAEANRRAAVAELALDQRKPPSVPKQATIPVSRGLETFAGQEYVLSVAPGDASEKLGSKIDSALLASGWRREGDISYLNLNSMAQKGNAHGVGLSIIVPGHAKYEQMRPALALQHAFAGSGLQPNIIRDPALPTNKAIIEISVGPSSEK